MNYVITGSIGNISKPVIQQLVAANHQVTVITSSTERVADIEAIGATAKSWFGRRQSVFNSNFCRCRCSVFNDFTNMENH